MPAPWKPVINGIDDAQNFDEYDDCDGSFDIGKADDVNAVDFNPFNEFLLATGGKDRVCKLWDLVRVFVVVVVYFG